MRPTITLILLLFASAGLGEEVDFARDIRPILSDNCFHCHGPDENAREAELRLDLKDGLFRKVDGVAIVAPGDEAQSELIRRVMSTDDDERMPPADAQRKLSPQQVELLRRWVKSGAKWKEHWSFQPLRAPALLATRSTWPRNPIDSFVLRRLESESLKPAAEAEKTRLLRRVTLDLAGLPPTIEELDRFLADDSPEAYERAVDRLLASPRYGQKMAWSWLDAARYADTNGFQGDRERTMWPWRDWVVRSFNRNLSFDQFTVWQIAGDLLPEASHEQKLATGFCRNHMINGEGGRIPEENRVEYVFDQIETVGTVWLGLTWQCCRCHDHKFDPLSNRNYYEFFAFFNQTPVNGGGGDPHTAPTIEARDFDQTVRQVKLHFSIGEAVQELFERESRLFRREENQPASAAELARELPAELKKILDTPIDKRDGGQLEKLEKQFKEKHSEYAAKLKQVRELKAERAAIKKATPRVMVMQDMDKPRKTFLLNKGLYNQRRDEVSANTPAVFPKLPEDAPRNRLALAKWLVDPEQPLMARVTVNRFWQRYFGTGLVKTVGDFGSQGERPSHPELLNWLAAEFVHSGWDVKAIQRLIVTSATYRQTARSAPESHRRDPENRLFSRGPRSRLPAWALRDQALAAGGLLVEQIGGASVKPYQPEGVWAEATFGKKRYQRDKGDKLYRRSLYSYWRRIVGPTMFFDSAKRQSCSVNVARTNTPLHALTTLNDVTFVEAARAMAQRVMQNGDNQPQRMESAFRIATSRKPSEDERSLLLERLETLKKQFAAENEAAKKLLSAGDSPRDERLDAGDHAAWMGICMLILNLDETLTK